MSGRLGTQSEGCSQVHRRDLSKNPRACGPCEQPSSLTSNTVASQGAPRKGPFAYGYSMASASPRIDIAQIACGLVADNFQGPSDPGGDSTRLHGHRGLVSNMQGASGMCYPQCSR
jgi:hypothetical protein